MNNGKVRIYELSRELNLDNKDILDICEGLNIAVKSHSSTITESEAERIRAASEKYSERPTAVKSRDSAASAEGGSGGLSTKIGRPNSQRKQQILEVRPSYKSRPDSSSQQRGSQLATPPQPPVKPPMTSPRQPNIVNKPTRVTQQNPQSAPVDEPAQKVPKQRTEQTPSSAEDLEEKPTPSLTEPPVRPSKPKPQLNQVERPVLKSKQVEAPVSETSSTPTPAKPTKVSPQPGPSESSREKPRTAPKPPVPALQGPPRRAPSRDEVADTRSESNLRVADSTVDDDDSIIETPEMLEVKLRRPNAPTRPVKKKEWVDEEEEGKETSKAGKAGAKLKRRPDMFLEDEEEFEELQEMGAPVTVSASVARPPKPKSLSGAVLTSAPSVTQRKRPQAKGSDHGSSKSDNRHQRRAKADAPERPEKIVLTDSRSMTIRDLAEILVVPETEIVKKLFFKGISVSI
ncbi:MAG TPA: translation initiation factor IF-2, partial [Cyanobacteria bacterium UBA8553]|nr:translation initiation factor IF-2 [Cyanobacteria bacterium UBA8553]